VRLFNTKIEEKRLPVGSPEIPYLYVSSKGKGCVGDEYKTLVIYPYKKR